MKRVLPVNDKQSHLLDDQINRRIIEELVHAERSVSELSKITKVPVVKIWRRVQALRKEALIEQTRSQRIGNLEKKLFRASALRYVRKEPPWLKPKNASIIAARQIRAQIRREVVKIVGGMNQVPIGADPIDFALAVDLYATSKTYLRSDVQQKFRVILEQVENSGMLEV